MANWLKTRSMLTKAGSPPGKTSAKRCRRNSVEAVRNSSCDARAEDDRRAAIEIVSVGRRGEQRADVEEELQRERQPLGRRKE